MQLHVKFASVPLPCQLRAQTLDCFKYSPRLTQHVRYDKCTARYQAVAKIVGQVHAETDTGKKWESCKELHQQQQHSCSIQVTMVNCLGSCTPLQHQTLKTKEYDSRLAVVMVVTPAYSEVGQGSLPLTWQT